MHRPNLLILGIVFFASFFVAEMVYGQSGEETALSNKFESSSQSDSVWRPNPTGAALRSLVLPGWGQAYNCNPHKALIYAGVEYGLFYAILRQHKLSRYYRDKEDEGNADIFRNDRNRMTWYLAGVMILAIVDAYVDAHLYDFDMRDDINTAVTVTPLQGGFMLGFTLVVQ